jgi:hypothetical protein
LFAWHQHTQAFAKHQSLLTLQFHRTFELVSSLIVHSQAAKMIAGAFAQSVNPALIANQFASINALSQSQVQATDVTYAAFTTIVLPGAAIDNTVCIHPNAERSASK